MKKLTINLIVRGIVIGMIIAALVYVQGKITTARVAIAQQQSLLEQIPEQAMRTAKLKVELDKRANDLARIAELVPSRDDLGGVINEFESQAIRQGLQLTIPKIEERKVLDASGVPLVVNPSPIVDVDVSLIVTGNPEELIQFLHFLETGPHVLSLDSWNIEIVSTKAVPNTSGTRTVSKDESDTPQGGFMEVHMVVAAKNLQQNHE